MDKKRKFLKSQPFSGPPHQDKRPGLFEDLNKAWQSIDLLKEQLLKAEKKLLIARSEPSHFETFGSSAQDFLRHRDDVCIHSYYKIILQTLFELKPHAKMLKEHSLLADTHQALKEFKIKCTLSLIPQVVGFMHNIVVFLQEKNDTEFHSKLYGQRKRKIFRLEDKVKPDSDSGVVPNGEVSALENLHGHGTETAKRDGLNNHVGANRRVYFVPETSTKTPRPSPYVLNVDKFVEFKKTLEDNVAQVENDYSDISLVPIKILNDRLPTVSAIQEEVPLYPKRKATRLDVQVTRPPKPPSPPPPIVPHQTYERSSRVFATSLIKGSQDWPSSSSREPRVSKLLKAPPGGSSAPMKMAWEPIQLQEKPFTSQHSKNGFNDQSRKASVIDPDRDIKTKSYPMVRKISSETILPKGYLGFTITGGTNHPKVQSETMIKHSPTTDSTLPTKATGPSPAAAVKQPETSKPDSIRKLHSGRPVKQKKVSCESKKVEDFAINPFSWRKGQALVEKELGPLKSSIHQKERGANTKQKSVDDDHDDPSTTLKSVSQLSNDVQGLNTADHEEPLLHKVPLQLSNSEANSDKGKTSDVQPVYLPKKHPKKLDIPALQVKVQSTPKLRHYDKDSVRKYMKKQQTDRRNKLKKEKLAQLNAKENQQQKLRDLEQRQKELAKKKVILPRGTSRQFPVESRAAWSDAETESTSHQSTDAFNNAVLEDDENDTDYIWDDILDEQVPRRSSRRKKRKDRDTFKTAPVACSTSASGNDESSGRENTHLQKNLPSAITSHEKENGTVLQRSSPSKHLDEDKSTNEKLRSLSALYHDKVDHLMNEMQVPLAPNYAEKEKKILSLREKALHLQEIIDTEAERLSQKLQLQQIRKNKTPSIAASQDAAPEKDFPDALNIGQLVVKLSKHTKPTSDQPSSISEGSLQSGEEISPSGSVHLTSKLPHDSVVSKSELNIYSRTPSNDGPKGWQALIPQEATDPYNFMNVLVRKRALVDEEDQQNAFMQENGSLLMVFSQEAQEGTNGNFYSSDFEDSSVKLTTVKPSANNRSSHNVTTTLPSRLSKESITFKMVKQVSSSQSSSESAPLTESENREASSAYHLENTTPVQVVSCTVSLEADTNKNHENQVLSEQEQIDAVLTPTSSASLSQHSLLVSAPPSDLDEQLSEGALSSVSDISQMLGVYSSQRSSADPEPRQPESTFDVTVGKILVHSELKQSENLDVKSDISNLGKNQENEDDNFSVSNVASLPNGQDFASAKMSPNTLRLRLSTELTYLDSVQESIGQLQDMERIRAVSLAQQEAVALAQVIQASQLDVNGSRPHATDSSYNLNPSIQLLQGQTEVAKLSAEATKQLVEINKTILEQQGTFRTPENLVPATDTVAAAAAAAVTAAISQLKQKLQQSRSNNRRARLDSFTASRSSDQLTTSGESERLQESSENQSSSSSSSSGHSQNRRNVNNRSESKSHESHTSRDERSKSSKTNGSIPEKCPTKSQSSVSSQNSIIEEVSSGPLSPSISECLGGAENNSKNEEQISSKLDTSLTEEEVEEKSFRMLLPSESHRRSSLGHRQQRIGSPASDISKRSSVSDVLSVSSEEQASLDAGNVLDDPNLFSGENSFQQFTLRMVRQYMKEEAMRAHHQNAILKLQEQALLEKTKAEIAWIKLQKRQCRIKGEDDKMPPLHKKQRTILLKLKHDKAEIKRIREAKKAASHERQMMLLQQEQVVRQQLSSPQQSPSLESDRQSVSSKCPSESSSTEIRTHLDADLKANSAADVLGSTSDHRSSTEIKSDSSLPDGADDRQSGIQSDSISKSKSLLLSPSPSTTQVLQGLKKLQISKRYLTKREQKLLQRRKNVEELLRWQQKLDHEEIEVQEMERKALEVLGDKRISSSNIDSQENSSPPSSSTEVDHSKGVVPTGAISLVSQTEKSSSVLEHLNLEKNNSHVNTISEAESNHRSSRETTIRTVSNSNDTEHALIRPQINSVVVPEKLTPSCAANYSTDTFESTLTLSRDLDRKSNGTSGPTATSVSDQTVVKARSVVLRSPLTPLRTQARKRRDSSGSEDSCTISQSETASDPSDIEGRIYALKRDLRQRKNEAERLRREQKRKNKERLKAQEASLLKQIEAYDRYILEAKIDLQKEIEQVGQAKPTVRPVIKQPKVAESKRLQRQLALDKSPEVEEKKGTPFCDSKDGSSAHTLPASAKQDGWSQLESNASSASQPTSLESSEGSFESVRVSVAADGDAACESDVRVGDYSIASERSVQKARRQELDDDDAEVSGGDYSSTTEETLKKTERQPVEGEATVAELLQEKTENGLLITSSHWPIKDEENQSISEMDAKSDSIKNAEHVEASIHSEIEIAEEFSGTAASTSASSSNEESLLAVTKNELLVVSYADSGQPMDFRLGNPLDDVDIAHDVEAIHECDIDVIENKKEQDNLHCKFSQELTEPFLQEDQVEHEESVSHMRVVVEGIVEYLLHGLLLNTTDELHVLRAPHISEKPSPSREKWDNAEDLVKINQSHRIAEVLLESLMNECIVIALKIRRESTGVHVDVKSAEKEELHDVGQEAVTSMHSEFFVSQRVNDILSEVNQEKRSPGTNIRPQDLLVLSFPEAFSPPEVTTPPPTGSPVKGGLSSPVRRPSSPVLGESAELGPVELEARLLALQDDADLLTDQEWFDDDFGLGTGSLENQTPIQHYQIYPYQDSYYIREIPNKPPPPYTPPGHALSTFPATALSPLTSTLNGTLVSGVDSGHLIPEIFQVVTYDEIEIRNLVGKAVSFCRDKVLGGITDKEEPDGYFSESDLKDDTSSRSRRSFALFVLHLTKDVVRGIYETESKTTIPPWLKPEWVAKPCKRPIPSSLEELVPLVQDTVCELVLEQKKKGARTSAHLLKWGRKKRDFVDEILLQELRREEAEWVTYDEDEVAVKMQLTDSIFDELITETVLLLQDVFHKKHSTVEDIVSNGTRKSD